LARPVVPGRLDAVAADKMMMMPDGTCIEELSSMGVRLRLYGCERMRRERMIGECIVSFSSLPAALDYPLEQWLTLEPRSNIAVRHRHTRFICLLFSRSHCYTASQSYGTSLAIWDHTELPATRRK